jgi:hypothetical protein
MRLALPIATAFALLAISGGFAPPVFVTLVMAVFGLVAFSAASVAKSSRNCAAIANKAASDPWRDP